MTPDIALVLIICKVIALGAVVRTEAFFYGCVKYRVVTGPVLPRPVESRFGMAALDAGPAG